MSTPSPHHPLRDRAVLWACLSAFVVWVILVKPLRAEPPPPRSGPAPFAEGEVALYELRYGPLKAGTLTLEVAPIDELPGALESAPATGGTDAGTSAGQKKDAEAFWRFVGRARSSSWISRFYRVDDSIEGWVERDSFRPRTLEIRVDESGERGTRHVLYDHDEGLARYERQRIYHRKRGPSMLTRDDPLDREAFDAFSLFFYLRTLALAPGDRLELPVHENGKNRRVQIDVVGLEEVATALGDRQALHLEIRWSLEGKLASRRAYHLWLANDDSRLPLRFAAELGFGSLRGVLQEVRTAEPNSPLDGVGETFTAQR